MSSPHRHGSKIVLRADGQRLSRKAPITYLSYTSSGPGRFPRQVLSGTSVRVCTLEPACTLNFGLYGHRASC